MAKLSFKKNDNFNITIPSKFIEDYLPSANGTFVKVYLYALMYSFIPNSHITINDIAKCLDILESDVYNAWKYWGSVGIVKIHDGDDGQFNIEFVDLTNVNNNKIGISKSTFLETKPNYSPKEIDTYINNSEEIKYLFKLATDKFGVVKNSNDSNILYSFYDWLRLPIEVIIMLLEYCSSNDKCNMRYIEKVAIDWADKGIDSTQRAEEHLKKLEQKNSKLNIIKNAYGIIDRLFTQAELSYIEQWINEYKFDIETIKLACENTIMNTGKATIKYTHSILEDWHNKKIKTVTQAKEDIINYKATNKQNFVPQKKPAKNTNNKFNNFSQEKPDFDKLLQQARENNKKNPSESRSS